MIIKLFAKDPRLWIDIVGRTCNICNKTVSAGML